MRTVLALMNRKLFFKDKGMLFTSMITPVILIVLYATFLAKVFRDSFIAAMPDMITISDKLINGTVAAQLTASLMAVSCITVTFPVFHGNVVSVNQMIGIMMGGYSCIWNYLLFCYIAARW